MNIDIQYVGMATSESMDTIMIKKLNRLAKRYNWIIRAQVFFRMEKDPTGKGKICEIELSAPGPRIFAKSNEGHFEKAAVATLGDLERQLEKRKEVFKRY